MIIYVQQVFDLSALPLWLQLLSYVYLLSGIFGLLYVVYDILKNKHYQKMRIMNVVWPVTVFYLGPLGIWAYYHMGHSSITINGKKSDYKLHLIKPHLNENKLSSINPNWESIFVSTTHCGAGCTIGDIISTWLIFFGGISIFGSALATTFILDFSFAWLLGIIFQYMAIIGMQKISLKQGIRDAIKADTLSLVAFEIGLFGWMAVVAIILFGNTWHADPFQPVFWFMMQIGMTIGFFTSYPANVWLVKKGIKHAM